MLVIDAALDMMTLMHLRGAVPANVSNRTPWATSIATSHRNVVDRVQKRTHRKTGHNALSFAFWPSCSIVLSPPAQDPCAELNPTGCLVVAEADLTHIYGVGPCSGSLRRTKHQRVLGVR